MLGFIEQWGSLIITVILFLGNIATAIYALIRIFNMGKKVDNNIVNTDEKIKITQNGIIEAFKTAKLPTDWKISVSNQVDKKLDDWGAKTLEALETMEAIRTKTCLLCLRILSNTVAAGKLETNEKDEVANLLKMITEEDATIDITLNK